MRAVVAAVIAASTLSSGCVCTLIGCPPNVTFQLPAVPLDDVARLAGASVEVCHHDVCGNAELPAPPDSSGVGSVVNIDDPILSSVRVTLWRFDSTHRAATAPLHDFDAGYTLEVNIMARDSVLVNGDRYSANAAEADGSLLAIAAFRASYRDYYPNGESCGGSPCRIAVLAPQ